VPPLPILWDSVSRSVHERVGEAEWRVWQIPQDQFIVAWNAAGSLGEVVERVKELVGGNVPRWAVMARATALRKAGVEMRPLPLATAGLSMTQNESTIR
jgi:hypothetical protein